MGLEFKSTFESFLSNYDKSARVINATNPYKFQMSTVVPPQKIKEEYNKEYATAYYKRNVKKLETSTTYDCTTDSGDEITVKEETTLTGTPSKKTISYSGKTESSEIKHTHNFSGTTGSANATHSHSISLTSSKTSEHTHTVSGSTSSTNAAHSHSFSGTTDNQTSTSHTHNVNVSMDMPDYSVKSPKLSFSTPKYKVTIYDTVDEKGDLWDESQPDNLTPAISDAFLDKDLILWVWTNSTYNEVISVEQPS